MKFGNVQVTISYTPIGDYHVLVHMYNRTLVNLWMLLDRAPLDKSKRYS